MKTKNHYAANILALALLMLPFGCTQEPTDVTTVIKEANQHFMAAYKSADLKTLSLLYTEDARLFPANSEMVVGRENIEKFWNGVMGMGIKRAELQTVSAEAIGNSAVEEGNYKLYGNDDVILDQGKYIVRWKKEGGQWKLHQDIWNTNNPAPIIRGVENDSIWIFVNNVLPNKVKQFEDYNYNYLMPAAKKNFPAYGSVRILRPAKANGDGTFSYIYLMDPAVKGAGYNMMPILTTEFGEAKAKELYKMFEDCLKDKKQMTYKSVQTKW